MARPPRQRCGVPRADARRNLSRLAPRRGLRRRGAAARQRALRGSAQGKSRALVQRRRLRRELGLDPARSAIRPPRPSDPGAARGTAQPGRRARDGPDYPLILSAGERRQYTAMTLIRNPDWRKRDVEGALRISAADAQALGLADGEIMRVSTRRGSCAAPIEINASMRAGHISLPNGYGLANGADGAVTGVP